MLQMLAFNPSILDPGFINRRIVNLAPREIKNSMIDIGVPKRI